MRYAQARNYLNTLRLHPSSPNVQLTSHHQSDESESVGEPYDLVIGVITMNRDNGGTSAYNGAVGQQLPSMELGYLTQTVAGLLKMLDSYNGRLSSSSFFGRTKLFVCNVDPVPNRYREPGDVSHVVEVVTRYVNASAMRSNRAYRSQDIFEREKDDYIYCLQQAVALGRGGGALDGPQTKASPPRYVMLVEDDVVVHRLALDVLSRVLRRRRRDSDDEPSLADVDDRWLFVKLYFPEKWLGYTNEIDRLFELVCVAAVGGSVGSIFAGLCFADLRQVASVRRQRLQTLVLFVAFAVYAVLLCVGFGRPHVWAWRRLFGDSLYRTVPGPDCCTQAVLYPVRAVDGLVRHLADQRCTIDYSIDIAIAGYARIRRLDAYLVDPNLVQHIGLVSSVRQYGKRVSDFLL